ncbi:ornithine cyclodeaminase family protein [Kitasatospora sp. GAS204B]|uniref:ornithine cyclodeaminase family protein n=1 Tax=unclassified Kitasatospora TaxID=2633591 RepID=UPI002473C355|nr:ornithine cyclodeaminase family protein [Kitasatospora sp. GAS204B]MDH6117273.1 alanine dehydrogenase [Kitasatospora sp. GAS204B]
MPPLLLSDADVRARLDPATAITAVRQALLAHHSGGLSAPARVHAELNGGDLVFTAGQLDGEWHGFRVYDTLSGSEQLVALWDTPRRSLRALVTGHQLGARRTGAIGAVAVDLWARPQARSIGLVGAGPQAWAQLWAIRTVRELDEVVVCSRSRTSASRFAARAEREFGLPVRVAADASEAVRERDIVVLATSSEVPVIETSWLSPGTHLQTLGLKGVERHEIPPDLRSRADAVCTDSRAQLAADSLFDQRRVVELGEVVAGAHPGRTAADELTVFCSVGLAGTEVAVAAALVGRSTTSVAW